MVSAHAPMFDSTARKHQRSRYRVVPTAVPHLCLRSTLRAAGNRISCRAANVANSGRGSGRAAVHADALNSRQ